MLYAVLAEQYLDSIELTFSLTVSGTAGQRFHKLNFIWNDWGDLTINDPRAKITSVLKYKSIPYHNSRNHQKLSVISHSSQPSHRPRGLSGVQAAHLAAQIASLEAVDSGEEEQKNFKTVEAMPDSPYKKLL